MKKVLKAAAIGASVLALAGTASAAELNMNIYGASAQGTFWNDYAEVFLTKPVANGGMGCASAVKGYNDSGKKLGMTVGINCAGNGGDNINIRYTSNKSVEGPRAVMKLDPQDNDTCITGNPTNDNLRKQATWLGGTSFGNACQVVHVGSSDVASESFIQESHGAKNGNFDTTQYDEVLAGQVIPGAAEIGTARQPIVVPFSFFANTSLAVDHINRQQALLLFSGNVWNWNQFGPGYPNKKVALCMRHAGSGTHSTLDMTIMRGDRSLVTQTARNVPAPVKTAGVMFHESSGNMIDCIQQNGGYSTATVGAIGYADADAIVASIAADGSEVKKPTATNIKRLSYNGGGEGMNAGYTVSALKNEIINGSYEFWATQWLYINKADHDTATNNLYDAMMNFASTNPLTCANGGTGSTARGCYWVTANDLKVTKELDSSIPRF